MKSITLILFWLYDKKEIIIGFIIGIINFFISVLVSPEPKTNSISLNDLLYAILLFSIPVIISIIIDFNKYKKTLNFITNSNLDTIHENYTYGLLHLITAKFQETHSSQQKKEENWINEKSQHDDDIAALIHEAKTPIAALKLIFENQDNNEFENIEIIKSEIFRLETILDRGLFTFRATSFSSDYLLEEIELRSLICSIASRFAPSFMNAQLKFLLSGNGTIVSDKKWLTFIISQFFSNALKYLSKGNTLQVSIMRENENIILIIQDDGNGIPDEDIIRIFDRGYSGYKNRSTNSSGMGLYLAKVLCTRLSHSLTATQGIPNGAKFIISFKDLPEILYSKHY